MEVRGLEYERCILDARAVVRDPSAPSNSEESEHCVGLKGSVMRSSASSNWVANTRAVPTECMDDPSANKCNDDGFKLF